MKFPALLVIALILGGCSTQNGQTGLSANDSNRLSDAYKSVFSGDLFKGVFERPARAPVKNMFPDGYLLSTGDKVKVTVFNQIELNGVREVSLDGTISVPLVGHVSAEGKTTEQVSEQITKLMRGRFLSDPQIIVEVDTYRPVYILGQVSHPGAYPYAPGLTVSKAVALAGGYTSRGDQDYVVVSRTIGETPGPAKQYSAEREDPIWPGDTIEIPRRIY